MRRRRTDRLTLAAVHFLGQTDERAHAEAVSAKACLRCGSTLGVRRHLTSLRNLAERRARIERHILHRSPISARLRRAADAALTALDIGSPARLTRALERVEELAR